MENQAPDSMEALLEKAGDYLETRVDLFKLKAVDKSSDIISSLASKVIVLLAFLIFFIIINIGIALLLGELFGKAYYGFFTLAGFYLIIGLVFHYNSKNWFKTPVADQLIRKFLK